MSCIKFPSSKTELVRTGNKENNYDQITAQIIAVANEEFGQKNWSHSITNQTLDFIESVNGQYRAGCASIVKVQLKDGTFHEDIAYSFTEGSTKGSAIMRARLSSFNGAFKKALTCFGNKVLDKFNSPPNIVSVSVTKEVNNQNNNKHELNSRSNSIIPRTNLPVNVNVPEAIPDVDFMPLSQTDALMNSVDLDNLVATEESTGNANKKTTFIPKVPHEAVKESVNATSNCNRQPVSAKTAVTQCLDTNQNLNNATNNNAELTSVSKPVVSTAMTEEEMRLERKRKQRERQEEFKRKEELKKKCNNGAVGAPPNARY
ncbi:DNA repair and recombination protein RAD52-like isoform X3 [Trichogramma pretiosum]|uniref:DNA repair and recombination protein RAD52-like isoform X3 n=1 Tax=Trichogramma pretiosum TaxID=7493 RepID=UPI000C71B0CF|nr:DNA repair and recombination protein RAD52-like isoform X3 [Trichogramma pretiosum]